MPNIREFIASQKAKTNKFNLLSFANFKGRIEFEYGSNVENNDLVNALKANPDIKTVILNGHKEAACNVIFSRFRKYLPKLKVIYLEDILPIECQITVDQFAKYFAKGIRIIADKPLMEHLQKLMVDFLMQNGQQDYAQQIQQMKILPCALDAEKVQAAILFKENKEKELAEKKRQQYREECKIQKAALEQLFADYKSGTGFDVNSKWFKEGPKEFTPTEGTSQLIQNCYLETSLTLYLVITKLNLWDVVAAQRLDGWDLIHSDELKDISFHPAVLASRESDYRGMFLNLMKEIAKAGSFQSFIEKTTAAPQAQFKM